MRWILVAGVLFVVAGGLALQGLHADPVPCMRVEAAPPPGGDPMAFPVVAKPGIVEDLDGAVAAAGVYRFERHFGSFRMRYVLGTEPPQRWGIGSATLSDALACEKPGLDLTVDAPSNDLVVRSAPDDVYVLTGREPGQVVQAFRSVRDGARLVWRGLTPLFACACALGALVAAIALGARVRRRAARLSTWREGVVGPSGTVRPSGGGTPLFLRGSSPPPQGASVLHPPAHASAPYRSDGSDVMFVVGTHVQLAAWQRRWSQRATGLVIASMVASLVALALLATSAA